MQIFTVIYHFFVLLFNTPDFNTIEERIKIRQKELLLNNLNLNYIDLCIGAAIDNYLTEMCRSGVMSEATREKRKHYLELTDFRKEVFGYQKQKNVLDQLTKESQEMGLYD